MDVLVMENVLYAANTTRIYDLKGSERSRWSPEDPTQAGAVLMDDNLRENNLSQPILVRGPLSLICTWIFPAVSLGLTPATLVPCLPNSLCTSLGQHLYHRCMSANASALTQFS